MTNFNPVSIAQAFDVPDLACVCALDIDMAKTYYEDEPAKAQQMINSWLEKPKSHFSKLPKQLHRVKFRQDIYDAITLLSGVAGLKSAGALENWMVHVINKIEQGINYHWAGIISAMIDRQMRDVLETNKSSIQTKEMHDYHEIHPFSNKKFSSNI